MNPEKQNELKKIIRDLHAGKSLDKVKKDFSKIVKSVSAEEIAEMENSLIMEGFPPEEIQRLCDVHVQVFEKSLKKGKGKSGKMPGHPVHTYILENKEAKRLIKELKSPLKKIKKDKISYEIISIFQRKFSELKKIIIHFQRKENQLFPFLEQKGFTGPSKVMWGKHDEIRGYFKDAEDAFNKKEWKDLYKKSSQLFKAIRNMIFMEEKILFPTSLRKLSEPDWVKIKKGEPEIGYAWIKPGNLWDANLAEGPGREEKKEEAKTAESKDNMPENLLRLDEGNLSLEQIDLMLKHLPIEISFVDENDIVRYYSANPERVFPRSPGVIGRAVQNCHPHKSVHIVNKILESFKKNEKKEAAFWIDIHGKFIYIKYIALYDKEKRYKGVIEVIQDATGIRKLEGEKRLLDW